MTWSVFISHSIKERGAEPSREDFHDDASFERALSAWRRAPALAKLRNRIAGLLDADPQFEPWLDQRKLQPPAEWRDGLHFALATADGAVLLLDEQALASDWVLKEATILTWLRAVGVPLVIVPVLINVSAGDLTARGFGPVQIREIQTVNEELPEIPAGDDSTEIIAPCLADSDLADIEAAAARILAAVRRGFAGVRGSAPQEDLQRWIDDVLSNLGDAQDGHFLSMMRDIGLGEAKLPNSAALVEALRRTGFGQVDSRQEVRRCVARELLLCDLDRAVRALRNLAHVDLNWRLVIGLVKPLCIEPNAAKVVPLAVGRPAGERIVIVDATGPETAQTVVSRAYFARDVTVVSPTFEDAAGPEDVVQKYLDEVGEWVRPMPEDVERYVGTDGPVFGIIDCGLPMKYIRAIVGHETLRHLTFVVVGGNRKDELGEQLAHALIMPSSNPPDFDVDVERTLKPLRKLATTGGR